MFGGDSDGGEAGVPDPAHGLRHPAAAPLHGVRAPVEELRRWVGCHCGRDTGTPSSGQHNLKNNLAHRRASKVGLVGTPIIGMGAEVLYPDVDLGSASSLSSVFLLAMALT